MNYTYNKLLTRVLIYITIILLFWSLFTHNILQSFLAILYIPFLYITVWRSDYTKILILILFNHWIQITIKVFYANVLGVPLENIIMNFNSANETFYLSIIGLYIITFGIYIILGEKYFIAIKNQLDLLKEYDIKNIFFLYLIYSLFIYLYGSLVWIFPGLTQVFIVFVKLKWGLLFILLYFFFQTKKFNKIITITILLEIVLGFSGFFSLFKFFLIFGMVTYLVVKERYFTTKKLTFIIITLVITLFLGSIWAYVKTDYRKYLTSGEPIQTSLVSPAQGLSFLSNLLSSSNLSEIFKSSNLLIERISYIDYFSLVIDRVPNVIPYENGQLTINILKHIFMPRLLDPKKAILDDSKDLGNYTGLLYVPGISQGTSIGMGYFSYIYIDYGRYLMLLVLFFWGLIIGHSYKLIFVKSKNIFWFLTFIPPIYLVIGGFETSLIKIVSGLIIYLIIFIFLLRPFSNFCDRLLLKRY